MDPGTLDLAKRPRIGHWGPPGRSDQAGHFIPPPPAVPLGFVASSGASSSLGGWSSQPNSATAPDYGPRSGYRPRMWRGAHTAAGSLGLPGSQTPP
eukprot:813706-Heterocapsa_arctica.AAC.1